MIFGFSSPGKTGGNDMILNSLTVNELDREAKRVDRYAKDQMEMYDRHYKDKIFQQDIRIFDNNNKDITEEFLRHTQGLYEGCRKFRSLKEIGWPITNQEQRRKDAWDKLAERCRKDETLKEMWDEIMIMGKLMED